MNAAANQYSVREAFQGSTVLITGATGYVGSLVLEQLLRVGHICKAYLLIRVKQGQDQQLRLRSLLESPIFRLHNMAQIVTKLHIINGDLSDPGCGINAADQARLITEVQYVVHSAASIRFDNPLHTDLRLSYLATKAIADLATRMRKLQCFMYVSTAYALAHSDLLNHTEVTTMEQLYPLRDDTGVVLDHAAVVNHLMSLSPTRAQTEVEYIKRRHNSPQINYGFCKNLTEQLIGSFHMRPYPVCISRPCNVGAIAKLPCPGYIGNSAAATAMILSIGCGVGTIQSLDPEMTHHLVPGDMATSIIVASMAATAAGQGSQTSPNITIASGFCQNPLLFGQLIEMSCNYFRKDPAVKYQFGDGKYEVHWTQDIREYDQRCQELEGHMQQLAQKLTREGLPKHAARAVTAWKVWRIWSDVRIFGGQVNLDDSNVQKLVAGLVEQERDVMMLTFTPKTTGMTWKDYLDLYCAGAKQLFMHETPKHPLQFGPALEAKASSRL